MAVAATVAVVTAAWPMQALADDVQAAVSRRLPSFVKVVGRDAWPASAALPDSVFNVTAGSVTFELDRTELATDDPFVRLLADSILPLARSNDWELAAIDLRGAASPEGPYNNNVRLSVGRAAALRAFLLDGLGGKSCGDIEISTIAEDYGYLVWLMEREGDPLASTVADIIGRSGGPGSVEKVKRALMEHDGGRLWTYLFDTYYPRLRAARVVLWFRPVCGPHVFERCSPKAFIPAAEWSAPAAGQLSWQRAPVTAAVERRHMLSLSTNLLYDAFYMPNYGWAPMVNVGVEFFPRSGKLSYRASFMFPYYHRWGRNKFFQIRDYRLEVRRYFNPGLLNTGAYLAAGVNFAKYGIGLSATKGWQGEGAGVSVKGGYTLPLCSGRWRLDFHAAVGAFVTRYDPYVYGNPVTGEKDGFYYYDYTGSAADFKRRNHRLVWLGPTEIGVTLSYDLLYYRIARRGASFLRKEATLW